MTEIITGEIYLEPEEEVIKNAKEIVEKSKNAEKYVCCILYEAAEKSAVLSEIKKLECTILEQSDAKSCVTVRVSKAQLAAIKSLNCIEKVEMADENIGLTTMGKPVLRKAENDGKINTGAVAEQAIASVQTIEAVSTDNGILTMCYGGGSGSDCNHSNTMQTARYLSLATWAYGCICCPGTEIWYRFTANVSNAADYTIYTSGSLDTVGYLYNSSGTLIASNDDGGDDLNFSITKPLTYGATYYVKVRAYGSDMGEYGVRVGYTTQSQSGGGGESNGSNGQNTAIQLGLNSLRGGDFCCPGAEIWYKFIPSETAYYTIYAGGSLDTVGYLYDSNNHLINSDDDEGSGLNFKMVHRLTANQTYYIKVTTYDGSTGSFSIKVTNTVFIESVTINDTYLVLNKGESVTLSAEVLPSYATNKTIRWESNNTSVVAVNSSTGKITAVNRGYACVRAYSLDGSGKSSCCEVAVKVPVQFVAVDTSTRVMHVGTSDRFTATVCPDNANNKLLRWTSSNTAVASVDSETGYVTAKAVGTANIYATAQDGTGKQGVCVLTVEPAIPVQSITMCCNTHAMNVGGTKYLSYDIYPANATNQSITWHSSNPNVAEVDVATGKITAKMTGATLITATTNDGCFADSASIYVAKTKVYQTKRTPRREGDGTFPEDLNYNDISVEDLKAMDWINWSDFVLTDAASFRSSWEYMCTSLFSTEPLQTVILDMIDHFMSGSAMEYSHETLTEKVLEHTSTQNYIEAVKNCIYQLLNLYNGDIMQLYYVASDRDYNPLVQLMDSKKIDPPFYNTANDKVTGLTICLDGLWGNKIEVKSYSKMGNSYSGVLSFTLYDHFGLDAADVEKYGLLPGFRSWYILQHNKNYNGAYKPFVTMINFDVPFSGTIG